MRPYSYAAWAKFKPGSSQTLRLDDDGGGPKVQFDLTYTLTGVAADAADITVGNRLLTDGKEQPNGDPYPARFPAKQDEAADAFGRTGTRDVTAAGRTFKCDVYEGKGEWGPCDNDATFVICTSGEVPGGVVEMAATFEDPEKRHNVFRLTAYTVK